MARSQSGSAKRCIATTNSGRQCKHDATEGSEYCHLDSHGPSGADSSNEESDAMMEAPTDRTFYEDHGEMLLDLKGQEARDGEGSDTSAARMMLKHQDASAEKWEEMFGTCAEDGCNRGCNGFETDYCGKPSHSSNEEGDEDGDNGDSDTITVEIDGKTVSGTKEEIQALLGQ